MVKKKVSIIIVHYRVKDLLFFCIGSIYKKTKKTNFEIVVVDNDEAKTIKSELLLKFPKVKYIANINKGFGQGNNVGSKKATGKYLFFINPDTKLINSSIDKLTDYLEKHDDVGIVSPLLYDKKSKIYKLQGFSELTPIKAIFFFSILNKLFPNNRISKNYTMADWNRKQTREVGVAPGTALMMKRKLFEEIKGFDESFFLYFEEMDLCKRVKKLNKKIVMLPSSKIIHIWGKSTEKSNLNLKKIYNESLFYYFRKHYGLINALIVKLFVSLNKKSLILFLILLLGFFLSMHKISELMPFIGDQAWFYLSARDMIITGNIPLVGITSSHLWLHQGALWTYILAPVLYISNFNPISGAYISVIMGLFSIYLIYRIGVDFFSEKFGIILSAVYATSPLVVFHTRFPYHTSPMPLFSLLLIYSLIKWVRGSSYWFPVALFSMSVLYNLELATVVFWPVIIFLIFFGYLKRHKYVTRIKKKSIIFLSFLGLFIPMIPIVIYDFNNGFPQTIVFVGWFFYKLMQILEIVESSSQVNSLQDTFYFFINKYRDLTVSLNTFLTILVFTITLIFSMIKFFKNKITSSFSIICLLTVFGLISFFVSNVPSEAYLVMLFPGLIFLFTYAISKIKPKAIGLFLVVAIIISNIYSLQATNYLMYDGYTFKERKIATERIIEIVGISEYNLIFKGPGQEFASSTASYEYLTWWLSGRISSIDKKKLKIIVNETGENIMIEKK